jgi:hypothetical protein
MTSMASSKRLTGLAKSNPYGTVFSSSPDPRPRMKRPFARWSSVTAVWASIAGCRRTVSTTVLTIGVFSVSTAAAAATARPSRCWCGDGETVANSVNSGVQMESGQKLTMWSGSQMEW